MATINNFEDLEVWQLARVQCIIVAELFNRPNASKEFEIRSQMKRSSGSVMDNIAEGFERGENSEFIHFLSIAKGSNGELRSQLYRMNDLKIITKEELDNFIESNKTIGKKINSFMEYLKNSNNKGFKFHKP